MDCDAHYGCEAARWSTDIRFGGIHLADEAHVAAALTNSHGDGVPRLRPIDPPDGRQDKQGRRLDVQEAQGFGGVGRRVVILSPAN